MAGHPVARPLALGVSSSPEPPGTEPNCRSATERFDHAVLPSHSGRAVPPMDIVLIEAMAKTRKPTGDMVAAEAGDAWSTKRCKVPSLPVFCTLGVPRALATVPLIHRASCRRLGGKSGTIRRGLRADSR